MIVTCRREKDGGRWTKSEEERLMLLRQAIVAGVEYVDLEEDIAASIPRFGKTKRIISYHNFQETPEDLNAPARPAVEPECRRREDRHDGPQPARQPAAAAADADQPRADRRHLHGRVRPAVADSGGQVRRAVHATPRFTPSGRWPRASSAISR